MAGGCLRVRKPETRTGAERVSESHLILHPSIFGFFIFDDQSEDVDIFISEYKQIAIFCFSISAMTKVNGLLCRSEFIRV